MKIRLVITLCLWRIGLWAQDYPVSAIAPELLFEANAVVRLVEGSFEIDDTDRAAYRFKKVVTVLNAKGASQGDFLAFYDRLSSISDLEFEVYDAAGERVKKAKSSDFYDRSAINGPTLYEDHRLKWYSVTGDYQYPYTVAYSFTLKFKFLFQIPTWFHQDDEGVSVERSRFSLIYPKEIGARYKERNCEGPKEIVEIEDKTYVRWEETKMAPFSQEAYSGSILNQFPSISLAPSRFEFEGYKGDMSSWEGFGKWIYKLNQDLEPLSKEVKADFKKRTSGMTPAAKVRYVYDYLQKNTRYVSIQFGIGGFQPFAPDLVHETGYGDCKALAFYTHSLLEAVGVKSYYTIISAGNSYREIDPSFPMSNFNHVILCVPNSKDTIWLECTSQTNPFGYLGSFTGNREALIIKEDGAHIVRTKRYPSSSNAVERKLYLAVGEDGDGYLKEASQYSGVQSEYLAPFLTMDQRKQKKFLEAYFDLPSYQLKEARVQRLDSMSMGIVTELAAANLFSKSHNRLFIVPNVLSRQEFVPTNIGSRTKDIKIRNGFLEQDSVYIFIPEGYQVEALFDSLDYPSAFGSYQLRLEQLDSTTVLYVRRFTLNSGQFPKEHYPEFEDFFKLVAKADRKKFSLLKSQ